MPDKIYLWIEDSIGKASYKFWTTFMNEVKVSDKKGTRIISDYEDLKEWWNNEE